MVLTQDEIDKWNSSSLEFFIHQKELSNELKGNYLREKSKSLIAQISLRYPQIFDSFSTMIFAELSKEEYNSSDIPTQVRKDAIYQIISVILNDETKVDIKGLIKSVMADVEKDKAYLIVKARALEILAKLSDFE